MPPRFAVSRLIALWADLYIAKLLSFLIVAPVLLAHPETVRFTQFLSFMGETTCETAPSPPEPLADAAGVAVFDLQPVTSVAICEETVLGRYNGHAVELAWTSGDSDDGFGRTTVRHMVPADAGGNPVAPVPLQDAIFAAILIFGGAASLRYGGGATPGKRIFDLRVQGCAESFGRSTLREAVKYSPYLAALLASGTLWTAGLEGNMEFRIQVHFAGFLGEPLLILILWIVPMIWWRGRMPHDRVVGATVARRDAEAVAQPS